MTAVFSRSQLWLERIWQDLQPTPGRLAATLRIVLTTVVALVLMMVLQLPFASLGLYYIYLVTREAPATSVKSGLMAIGVLAFAVAAELIVVIVSDNDPTIRLLSVGVVSLVSGAMMAASPFAPLAAIWGFVYCTLIALWETRAPADALVRASLMLLATVTLAFLCSVVVEYVFAFRRASDRLADQIALRYRTVAGVFELLASGASRAQLAPATVGLNRLAGAGQGPMQTLLASVPPDQLDGVMSPERIGLLAQVVDAAAAFASHHPDGVDEAVRARCAAIAARCRTPVATGASSPLQDTSTPGLLERVEAALHDHLELPQTASGQGAARGPAPSASIPLVFPGALQSRDTAAFALKVAVCSMACYIFYIATGWPGISTAVTTVFLVALGSSGAIKQKLTNRLVGSIIGGALAVVCAVFVFPQIDSIVGLVIVVAAVAFLAAWWGGGRQFGYTGLQIAFSFYIVAFEGFSAPTDLVPVRDRLIGIAIALFVIWVVFDRLWPVRTVSVMRRSLAGLLGGGARLFRIFSGGSTHGARIAQLGALRAQMAAAIANLRTLNDTVEYEFGTDREAHRREGAQILDTALSTVPIFFGQAAVLQRESDEDFVADSRLVAMRSRVIEDIERMAQALAGRTPFSPTPVSDLADASLLADSRFGDYVRHTLARHAELQTHVAGLASQPAVQ